MTDGSIVIGSEGELFKTFNAKDGLGITLAHKCGLKTAIITGRESTMLAYRAKELGITAFYQNCKNKLPAYKQLQVEFGLKPEEIAYIGDDLIDLGVMHSVGLPVTVADAVDEVKQLALLQSDFNGGRGAVRQIIEFILKAQGKWQQIIELYSQVTNDAKDDKAITQ